MKKLFSILIILLLSISATFAQKSKGETGTFALTNAKLHTITNGVIERGTIILKDGIIAEIGPSVSVPADAILIDCSGLEIYPGMIDGGTRLGLTEVGSDPRTQDYNEVGEVIPHMKALTAVNPNSVLIPVTRVSGVTTVLTVPGGGIFPGTAALINLHGYTPQQMHTGFSAVVMNFPSGGRRGWWDRRTDEEIEKAIKKSLEKLDDVWEKVKQYHKIDSAITAGNKEVEKKYYPEMEALLPVYRNQSPLLVEVNKAKDIKAAIKWVQERNINTIFTGVNEGWRVAEELAKANIPVIVGPVLSVPGKDYYRFSRSYDNPGLMKKAGVKVAIRTMESENVRNLPYNAGFAAAYGMSHEDALKAITIVPAEIFNVADKLGSLEKGKQATLFVTDGDPFETSTDVKHVFIEGWKIPMESRHTKLYEEFLEREPGLKK